MAMVNRRPKKFINSSTPSMANKQFHIRQIINNGGTVSFQVSGMLNRRQVRNQFKLRAEAVAHVRELELSSAKSPLQEPRLTWLTHTQLAEAEAALTTIHNKFPTQGFGILKSAQYFVQHFWIPISDHTILTATVLYSKAKADAGVRPSQLNTIAGLLKRFGKAFPNLKLHEFTRAKVQDWLETNLGDRSPKTWNNIRGDLGSFFTWCASEPRKWIPASPAQYIEDKLVPKTTPMIISVSTAKALMAEVEKLENGSFAVVVALMLFAGIRPDVQQGEIKRIVDRIRSGSSHADFNVAEKQIYLGGPVTKTGSPRWIDLPPNLIAWLVAYPLTEANVNLSKFGDYRGRLRKTHAIPHDGLRHSFCSYYAKLYGPGAAALAAGHSESMQRNSYLNGGMSVDDAKAFFAIMPTSSRLANAL